MEYLDHKRDKQYKFQKWVRESIQEMQVTYESLLALARVLDVPPDAFAKAINENIANNVYGMNLASAMQKAQQKVESPKVEKVKKVKKEKK